MKNYRNCINNSNNSGMKTIHFQAEIKFCIFLLALSMGSLNLKAQIPDLQATENNGILSIRVKNTATFDAYFHPDQDSRVSLDFYFAPDHQGNGLFAATPLTQDFGEILLSFPDISYTEGDSLTFSATETLNDGSLREYLFKKGIYRGAGDPITQCPVSMECKTTSLSFVFPSSIQLGISSLTPLSIFIPGIRNNGYYPVWGINLSKNAIVIKDLFKDNDCDKIMDGTVIIVINGITCVFKQGILDNSTHCSSWGTYFDNGQENCAEIFESCAPEIIHLLSDNKWTLPCKQWVDNNLCTSTATISRPGKIAIGTLSSSNVMLTVKNGIITDRVRVQLPVNLGWGDYVFSPDYVLKPLEEVATFIKTNHHLPDTPSSADIMREGSIDLGEVTMNQQVKIEEIFLHLIQIQEELERLEQEILFITLLNKLMIK